MISETIGRIREHLRTPGVTKKGLAAKAGLHPNTLLGIERSDWNPSARTLEALESAMTPEPETRAA